jgi:hypothetical protein
MNDIVKSIIDAINYQFATRHFSRPGRIESFDPATGKAEVKPLVQFPRKDKDSGEVTTLELPVIPDVPVAVAQGGGAKMTFPVSAGDPCLLIFSEVSLDEWLTNGGDPDPKDFRRNNLSDAMAIVGLGSFADWEAPLADKAALTYEGTELSIDNFGKIAIGNSTAELFDVLSQTLDKLATATVATSLGPQPLSNAADYVTLKGLIDGLKGAIG